MNITWEPVDCLDRRSEITNYTVYYGPIATYSEASRSNLTGVRGTSVVAMDLMADTVYAVQVAAVNRQGLMGPSSALISTTTSSPRESCDYCIE